MVLFLLGAVIALASQLGMFKGYLGSRADDSCKCDWAFSGQSGCNGSKLFTCGISGTPGNCSGWWNEVQDCAASGKTCVGGESTGGSASCQGSGGTGGGVGGESYGKNWGNTCSGGGYGMCNAGSRCVGGSQCGSYNCFKVDSSCGSSTICTPGQIVKATSTTYRKCNGSGTAWVECGTSASCGSTPRPSTTAAPRPSTTAAPTPPTGGGGSPCTSDSNCQSGSYCNLADYRCKNQGGFNSTCTKDLQCQSGMFCAGIAGCQYKGDTGATCSLPSQCKSGVCNQFVCIASDEGGAGSGTSCGSIAGTCEWFCDKGESARKEYNDCPNLKNCCVKR